MKGRCSSLQAELEEARDPMQNSAAIVIDYFLRKIQQAAAPASTRLLYLPMTQAPLLWQYQPWR